MQLVNFIKDIYSDNNKFNNSDLNSINNDENLIQQNNNEAETTENEKEEEEDRIAKVFDGKKIFITGGSGFIGKVLIEKLLRCCRGLETIYVLIRSKKGLLPEERLIKNILSNPLYDLVKRQLGEDVILSKLKAISGNVMECDLGMYDDDKKLITENVSIIYHCAATVRFDESLKKAVLINTRGTKYMIDLARECKKLIHFVYISTAYCHGYMCKTVEEKPYPPPYDPIKMIHTCEILSEEVLEKITDKILGKIPNTYHLSKALAEDLVVKTFNELPSVIMRPSIVIPIWREPLPGWIDNINGPTGLLIGAGKGVIRTMYCKSNACADFVPVDLCANGILLSTWHTLTFPKSEHVRIAHMTSYKELRITWEDVIEIGRYVIENKVPLDWVVWYPGGSMKSNKIIHYICFILFQCIPAVILDGFLICLGYPPVLCRVQKRIYKSFEIFEYFADKEWNFTNENVYMARDIMNKTEKRKYVIEKIDVDYLKYFEGCVLCARRYILKEKDEDIPRARRHMKIMWFVDRFLKFAIIIFLLYFLYSRIF